VVFVSGKTLIEGVCQRTGCWRYWDG